MNAEYPANGPGSSFFTVAASKMTSLVEFWPEPYPAPANRRHRVEPLS